MLAIMVLSMLMSITELVYVMVKWSCGIHKPEVHGAVRGLIKKRMKMDKEYEYMQNVKKHIYLKHTSI